MCCSNDTAAATGIFTPHVEISPFCYLLFFRIYSIHPKPASIVRVSPSKTGSIGFTQPKSTNAPSPRCFTQHRQIKRESKINDQRIEEPDYLQRAESFTHQQQLCGSLVIR